MTKNRLWHVLFLIGILFKGLDGVLECLGGLVFLFIKHDTIIKYAHILFQNELAEDPHDIIANYLVQLAVHTSRNTEFFAGLYLMAHGIIKLLLFAGLYRKKLWIYPVAEIILALLVIYQLYRFGHTLSVLLILLSLLDIFIIFLIRKEHRRLTSGAGIVEV